MEEGNMDRKRKATDIPSMSTNSCSDSVQPAEDQLCAVIISNPEGSNIIVNVEIESCDEEANETAALKKSNEDGIHNPVSEDDQVTSLNNITICEVSTSNEVASTSSAASCLKAEPSFSKNAANCSVTAAKISETAAKFANISNNAAVKDLLSNELNKSISTIDNALLQDVTSKEVIITNNSFLQSQPYKKQRVDIYTDDPGPKWYNVTGCNVTQVIDPKKMPLAFDFLPIYGRPVSKGGLEEFQENKIREFVGCDMNDEDFAKLAKYCSPEQLKSGKEIMSLQIDPPLQGVLPREVISPSDKVSQPQGYELCVAKKFKMRSERDFHHSYPKKLKYRGLRLMPLVQEEFGPETPLSTETLLEPGKDILLRVRIYRPFTYYAKARQGRVRHSVFSRDIVLVGRQLISELRDRIVCSNDVDMGIDISHRINDPPLTTAKELFPSGFVFINNVFYIDTRPGCIDLTERTREWASKNKHLGTFPVKDMCQVTLDQLRIRLGHPEVYVHRGNCEHLFTFSEIRLLNSNDPLNLSHYPCHTAVSQNQTVYCTSCAEFGAKWMITGCDRVPFDPAFFCDTCLSWYLYKDGKKVGDFKAYAYRGNEINVLKPQG